MKRELRLMRLSVEELFDHYDFECTRINYEDKKAEQKAIREELKCRMDDMFRLLERETVDVHKAYKSTFLQPALKSKEDTAWQ